MSSSPVLPALSWCPTEPLERAGGWGERKSCRMEKKSKREREYDSVSTKSDRIEQDGKWESAREVGQRM